MALNEPQSRYRQLADTLRAKIESGEYPRGSHIPSEPDLARTYGVSQVTANKAISILRNEGLVRVERGKRTTVHEIPPLRRAGNIRYVKAVREEGGAQGAFAAELARHGYEPRSALVECGYVAPHARVAETLGVPEGEQSVLIRKRHMFANNLPVQLSSSYIPRTIAEQDPRFQQEHTGDGGIKSRFAELGYTQVKFSESIRTRRPTPEERVFLRLSEDQLVNELYHVAKTEDGKAIEVRIDTMPTHQWILDYEWEIDG